MRIRVIESIIALYELICFHKWNKVRLFILTARQ